MPCDKETRLYDDVLCLEGALPSTGNEAYSEYFLRQHCKMGEWDGETVMKVIENSGKG